MEVGIGLPAAIRGVDGRRVTAWAQRAERQGFSSLGLIDRIAYDNYEPLVAMAAAAAVTERIRLMTSVLLAPLRPNHTLFAKQVASLDLLSEGRFVLGLAVGRRTDDYSSSDVDFHHRGRDLDALLLRARAVWNGELDGVGPRPATAGGPPIILGGASPAAYRRVAREAVGWIASGGMGDVFRSGASGVRAAWSAAGRPGRPRLHCLGYFALGDQARAAADAYLHDYYGFLGPGADQVAAAALASKEQVQQRVADLEAAGCDELILLPCDPDLAQVDLLSEAVRG